MPKKEEGNDGETDWAAIEKQIDKKIKKGLKTFRDEIERVWHEKAVGTLRTRSQEYIAGTKVSQITDGVMLSIDGWLPVALEQGAPRFDMKVALLKTSTHKRIPVDQGVRTMSINSPPGSWWHPGIEARRVTEQVKSEANEIARRIFSDIISRTEV